MKITPLMIEIILHYHWSSEDEPGVGVSPATDEACEYLYEQNILLKPPGCKSKYYGNRDAIQSYIDELLKVQLPEQKWVVLKKA